MPQPKAAQRICLIGEAMAPPLDEGRKKLVYALGRSLAEMAEVRCLFAGAGADSLDGAIAIPDSRLLLNRALVREIRAFKPDTVCYVPYASGTLFSFLRCALLQAAWPTARYAIIVLQPRDHGPLSRRLISWLRPDVVFVQEETSKRHFEDLGCRVRFLASGVDLDEFSPLTEDARGELRSTWGFDESDFVVLHVGHIKEGRNVAALAALGEAYRTVVVGSTSTRQDARLAASLRSAGVLVLDEYIADIRSLYRAADCFVFPVESPRDSIGVPLSVLEAMACNTRVVSTPFGGLPTLFPEGGGLLYANARSLAERLRDVRDISNVQTREMVSAYPWSAMAKGLLAGIAKREGVEPAPAAQPTLANPTKEG